MKGKQTLLSLLLCAALAVSLCPTALADGGVPYLDESGNEQTYPSAVPVTNLDTAWSNNWYVASDGVEISSRVTVTGDVHLILADNCVLTVNGGINVSKGNSLTIYAQSTGENTMGKLTATATDGNAGIGGGCGKAGGTITINGGDVTATSDKGAGIGGGDQGEGGQITISGGTVTATASFGDDGSGGAGIGGGYCGAGGEITITGGTVTASSVVGAGIGGGDGGAGGEIAISGGTVRATSSGNGAGIGGGEGKSGGEITITGGTVEASSRYGGAGIGGGNSGAGHVIINGGTVTAHSCSGAGIGGGNGGEGGNITISGGTVTATSERAGAGIGGGERGDGGEITISGGAVTATSLLNGAGIGGGEGKSGGKITISGGKVTATSGGNGAGIGGGEGGASGNFTANGSAFITASRIDDQSGKNSAWSGVIFEGTDSGKVYGSEITLAADAEIPANGTLEIEAGHTLIVGADVTLTNNGKITNSGTIINNGKIINSGTISGAGIIVNHGTITGNEITGNTVHEAAPDAGWQHDGSGHWHPCTVADCIEHTFDTDPHTPGDWIVDQAATSTEAGQRHKECTACGYTMQTETIPATGGGSGGGYIPPVTPVTPTYPPTVEQPGQGGGVSVSPSNPKQGDTVTVTPEPDDGYEMDKITVTDKNGKGVEVTRKPDGTCTFTQPGGKVTIEVTYRPVERPWNNPFSDVFESDWYYEAVRFVQERGLMNGYGDGRFGANDTLSRAQLAQILFNKEGRPGVNYLPDFSDVASEAWYAEAIRWAASQGIAGGYGDGTFGPNDPITREQMAIMLWRYSGSPAASGELRFADAEETSGFALEAMRWAVENGILNGYGDGRLGPRGQATRAQAAQMLKNFIEHPYQWTEAEST